VMDETPGGNPFPRPWPRSAGPVSDTTLTRAVRGPPVTRREKGMNKSLSCGMDLPTALMVGVAVRASPHARGG